MMDPKQIAMHAVKFNKAAFNNIFGAMKVLQDQTDKMIAYRIEQTPLLPLEVKKAINDGRKAYRKGYADFKTAVDEGCSRAEEFFATPIQQGPGAPCPGNRGT